MIGRRRQAPEYTMQFAQMQLTDYYRKQLRCALIDKTPEDQPVSEDCIVVHIQIEAVAFHISRVVIIPALTCEINDKHKGCERTGRFHLCSLTVVLLFDSPTLWLQPPINPGIGNVKL